ncbi:MULTISPECIES: MerR family DNA-binding transcriptional regulator, partial [unclassified Pseudoalteromonas]
MKIGDVAKTTGCSIQTIRFYEKKGLLPELKRSSGNYRVYDKGTIEQLLFIKQCRS